MKPYSLFILVLLFLKYSLTFGQNETSQNARDSDFIKYNRDQTGKAFKYGNDTILFESESERHILMGTTILPWTNNQINALVYGIKLFKVKKSNCQRGAEKLEENFKPHINSLITTDTSIIVDFNIVDYCCYDFLCDIKVDKKGTIKLLYYGFGNFCSCTCCYGLTYHLSLFKSKDNPRIKAIMIQGDTKTLKKIKNY